jgi:hypothetical protein
MATRQRESGRGNALKGELRIHVEERSGAPAEAVYDLLADIGSHLEWGGAMQPKQTFRLLSMEAPEAPASVGTEFRSTGADAMGRFADTSVVTEAVRPRLFEFVTEARLTTKKGGVVEWTIVHRYELASQAEGCRISYAERIVRVNRLPGALAVFGVPGLRRIGLRISSSFVRKGIRNLSRQAERRAGAR